MTESVASATAPSGPLEGEEARLIDAWWRAANYLSVGQIYLLDNPLLRRPLSRDDVKPRLLGHWGTTPGLNFIHAHANRVIRARDLDAITVIGPGHGGPAAVASAWMEGSYTELYPTISRDEEGMRRLFRQFSFPGGIGSHVTPETPGSLHEGGELGYSLVHAYGAAFDDPDLVVFCIVGDGEAETGPLAASWHSTKFVDPVRDGTVVPILHLNGYKIANPTVLARIPDAELEAFFIGHGYRPHLVAGDDPAVMHQQMAGVMDVVMDEVAAIHKAAREDGIEQRPIWPMIVLRSPKGWTGPRVVDGLPAEGSFRSHQVPLSGMRENPEHLAQLESWLLSYRPAELFTDEGSLQPDIAALAPSGHRRMTANPRTNGGLIRRDLDLPDFRDYAVEVPAPGRERHEATRVMGTFLRDVITRNPSTFRIFGPDETELQPPGGCLRGHRPRLGSRHARGRRAPRRAVDASSRSSASTSARASSRATC